MPFACSRLTITIAIAASRQKNEYLQIMAIKYRPNAMQQMRRIISETN